MTIIKGEGSKNGGFERISVDGEYYQPDDIAYALALAHAEPTGGYPTNHVSDPIQAAVTLEEAAASLAKMIREWSTGPDPWGTGLENVLAKRLRRFFADEPYLTSESQIAVGDRVKITDHGTVDDVDDDNATVSVVWDASGCVADGIDVTRLQRGAIKPRELAPSEMLTEGALNAPVAEDITDKEMEDLEQFLGEGFDEPAKKEPDPLDELERVFSPRSPFPAPGSAADVPLRTLDFRNISAFNMANLAQPPVAFCGMGVVLDPNVPPNTIELRDPAGGRCITVMNLMPVRR